MNNILIYSLSFNVISTLGMLYYTWRIVDMRITPPFTWSLALAAFFFQTVQITFTLYYIWELSTFISNFPPLTLLLGYGLDSMKTALLLAFTASVYSYLDAKLPPNV